MAFPDKEDATGDRENEQTGDESLCQVIHIHPAIIEKISGEQAIAIYLSFTCAVYLVKGSFTMIP